MAPPPGPKELMLRAMREDNASRRQPPPSKTELRDKIAKVKGGGGRKKKGGGRGR